MSAERVKVTVPHIEMSRTFRARRTKSAQDIADCIGRVIARRQVAGDHRAAADEAFKYIFGSAERTDAFIKWFEKDGGR